jgi:hypothetical protein
MGNLSLHREEPMVGGFSRLLRAPRAATPPRAPLHLITIGTTDADHELRRGAVATSRPLTDRIAHLSTAGDCCTAGFRSDLCRRWVSRVRSRLARTRLHVRCTSDSDRKITTGQQPGRSRRGFPSWRFRRRSADHVRRIRGRLERSTRASDGGFWRGQRRR